MSIIGKWRTIWSSRGGDFTPDTLACEYTDSEFIQQVQFPNGLIKKAVVKCEHPGEGKATHFLKGRDGLPTVQIDYAYEIDEEGILTITSKSGTWKLTRIDESG